MELTQVELEKALEILKKAADNPHEKPKEPSSSDEQEILLPQNVSKIIIKES